ncbi:MAG: alpha-galactosidase [Defluviitaleaceae bacterium]|nr:alpha-galactosidase [Defluviitaleaceae bacterium]
MVNYDIFKEPVFSVSFQSNGALYSADKSGDSWCWKDAEACVFSKLDEVSIMAQNTPLEKVIITWRVDMPLKTSIMGDHWERGYGDLEFRGFAPERKLPWYFLAVSGKNTWGVGVKTGCGAFCSWKLTRDRLTLILDVQNGGMGVLLKGRTLIAAHVVSAESDEDESTFAFGKRFCSLLCDKPVMPEAPVYGGNNWYYAYGNSSHDKILQDSDFIASLSAGNANRPYMFIDDGWEVCHNGDHTGGPWHIGNSDFPDMPGLAAKMKDIGVKPGVWIRPLLNAVSVPKSWWLPGNRYVERSLGFQYPWMLDPSIPDVLEFIREDFKRLVSWGYNIKHDYTTYDILGRWGFDMGEELTNPGWHFADRTRTTMEIILDMYRVMAEASGDALVVACNTVSHATAGIFAMQRTGDDTSGFDWHRTRKMGVNTMAFRAMQHGAFYAADADCVGITPRIDWSLNKQWLDLVAKSGTPLLVSIDPATADTVHKAALKDAFKTASVEQPIAEPLDWLYNQSPCEFKLMGENVRYKWDGASPGEMLNINFGRSGL